MRCRCCVGACPDVVAPVGRHMRRDVAFRKADGSAFPGCSSDAASMWADSAYLTADGRKALLAVLLTARTTNSTIRVYYTTADGYCRFQVIDIE